MGPMTESLPFADRTDAGERLAALLDDREVSADLVLAIPRGVSRSGVPSPTRSRCPST